MRTIILCSSLFLVAVRASCPYMAEPPSKRSDTAQATIPDILSGFIVDDSQQYMTSDAGGPIDDQASLKMGSRGPTLLEDFTFRQKIMHFDHERVPERAVHARGAGQCYLCS
jgi:catalase